CSTAQFSWASRSTSSGSATCCTERHRTAKPRTSQATAVSSDDSGVQECAQAHSGSVYVVHPARACDSTGEADARRTAGDVVAAVSADTGMGVGVPIGRGGVDRLARRDLSTAAFEGERAQDHPQGSLLFRWAATGGLEGEFEARLSQREEQDIGG